MSLEGTVNSLVVWEQGAGLAGCNMGGCRAHPSQAILDTRLHVFTRSSSAIFIISLFDLFIKSSVVANNSSEINSLLEMWDLDFMIDGKSNGFFIWKKDSWEHWK